nr:annexin-B12-like [Cherax quadricarinatus]
MKGIGTDARVIIQELTTHQNIQRQEIVEKYKDLYGRDLRKDLMDELGGTFEEAVLALLDSPNDLLVNALNKALKGHGTDEKTLIDILCCLTPDELESLRDHYRRNFNTDLDDDLQNDLSGDFKMLMCSLVAAGRNEDQTVDPATAATDAQTLYDAGVGKNSETDEEEFIRLFNNRSFPQLKETFEEYQKLSGSPIEDAVSQEFSGDIKTGLLAIVQRVKDPLGFFCERLNTTMEGPGTDDTTLIRLLVSRSELAQLVGVSRRMSVKGDD